MAGASGSGPQVWVWQSEGAPAFLAARSQRWCARLGFEATVIGIPCVSKLASAYAGRGLVLLRAGAWPATERALVLPPPSASGRGVCAVATPRARSANAGDDRWREIVASAGGDIAAPHIATLSTAGLPPLLYLDPVACDTVFAKGRELAEFLSALLATVAQLRVVAWPALEVFDDPRLRVLQIVTSLQRGGAERIALNLATLLPRAGVHVRLAAPYAPTRDTFTPPAAWLDLAPLRRTGESALDALLRLVPSFDLLHLHLFKPRDLARFIATGVPSMVTVHNSRAGWPEGFLESRAAGLALLAACSLDVAAELDAAGMAAPVRTVWNGIDFDAFAVTSAHAATRAARRREWVFGEDDLVLIAIANPRSQKRLHLLPPVLAGVQTSLTTQGSTLRARLVFAGQPSENLPDAQASAALVRETVTRLGLEADVRWAGAVDDVAGLLAAGDVLVSASGHEGLSLVQLEALAHGRPVVCTATAGAREVAHRQPAVRVLPLDATPEVFADAILAALKSPVAVVLARRHFDQRRMAERYLWWYHRCVSVRRAGPAGLWLITNNFSMGGAQTSARRLLVALTAAGVRVRAATLQEEPAHPTVGRRALAEAGVTVRAFGPHGRTTPEEIATGILDTLDADPPETVLFWNVIPVYKLLLADGVRDARVFDISPGEMFFHSLRQYFERPQGALPFVTSADYGRRLAGVIVKYRAESAIAANLGAPVHVIPNGVPLPPFPARPLASRPVLVFGTATRLSPQKRFEDVLAALHLARDRLPPFEFHVAGRVEPGDEAYHAALVSQAKGLPVRWLGELPGTAEFLSDLDLFLMSSEPAGCPNALLEALAAGLPTIATDVGGAGEQVLDGVTGCLVPARDVAAFAEALVALAHDPARRAALGRAARQHMEENFGMERMVEGYRAVCLGK